MATEKKGIEKRLAALEWELKERNKALNCIYGIAALVEQPGIKLEELVQGIVDLIPTALQYPEIACARAILDGQEFKTENFRETPWKQTSDIVLHGERIGYLELDYLEEKPESDEGPFLKEERRLINTIAERLGKITERVQAVEALYNERDNLKNILNAMEDGIYIVNKHYDIQFANPVLIKKYGIYEGRKCYEYICERTEICPDCKLPDIIVGKTVRWEWYVFKYQTTYDLIDTPLINVDGSISKLGIFRDITERLQAEEVLHQYEHIVSSSTDKLALLDKRFNYLAVNKAFMEAFKLTPEQLIGNSMAKVFGEEFFNTVIKPKAQRCLGGEEVNYQEWFDYPAHGRRYMDITYYPYYSEDNKVTGFVVNGRDNTEHKQAKENLQKSEQKFRDYVETSQDLMWECDTKGRFTYLNPAWEQVTGYKLSEMLGKPFTYFYLKENVEKKSAEYAMHLESGSVNGYPSTYISKDGSEIALIFKAIRLYDSNKNIIGTQ
ncbi:MAG: PAS domain-containing protein, partial [Dehalococcoidia bacterium]